MTNSDDGTKQRDATVAENETRRQVAGDIRVSVWAAAIAVLIGAAFFAWVLFRQ